MRFAHTDIEIGSAESVIKEVWQSDLVMVVEMALLDNFPLGILGLEMARKAAERKGTTELFEEKLQKLRSTIKTQVLQQRPDLAPIETAK